MLKRIHVNKHKILSNHKHGLHEPVVAVRTSKGVTYGHEALIHGVSRVVYRPEKPLSCGAVLWVETKAEVVVLDKNNLDARRIK